MVREATADDIDDLVSLVMEYREFYGVKNQDADEVRNFMKARLENGLFGFGAGFCVTWGYYLSGRWKRGISARAHGLGQTQTAKS